MKRMRRIESPKVARLLFLLCWFAYFTSYIGRLNYSSAMTAMIQEAVLTKSQAGFISMVYFFAYGIGQFCNGMLGDRFHPGKMIFVGLAIAAGANLCMGFVGGFGAMAVVWGINGYAQAMIWPPVIRIFAEMVSREQKMKFCVSAAGRSRSGSSQCFETERCRDSTQRSSDRNQSSRIGSTERCISTTGCNRCDKSK